MEIEWKCKGTSLCVLGFQDPDLTEVSRDSPTLSAPSDQEGCPQQFGCGGKQYVYLPGAS